VNIPDTIGCAHCGKPLTWANSYGLSTPLTETRIKASDFCDLACLAAWTADVADLATNRVKRN
jgi:hypothetical protein